MSFLFAVTCSASTASEEKILTLVYKDIGNPPYMQPSPDNSGLYLDLMTIAVERIGYKLKILRPPKKRGYRQLERGVVDLYASGEFRENRSKFLHYFANGLSRKEVFYGLTTANIPDLYSISDINLYDLTWIFEAGSSWPEQAVLHNVQYSEIKQPNFEKALTYLQSNRSVFFKIEQQQLKQFLENTDDAYLNKRGIKVHQYCCEPHFAPLYTGFSRFSPLYEEQPNPFFDNSKVTSPENFPSMLVPNSIPDQLKNALQEMIDTGEIDLIKQAYKIN